MLNKLYGLKPLLFVLLFSTQVLSQQSGTILGTVVDDNDGQPLIGANIVLEGSTQGTSTNLKGEFILKNIATGEQNLIITYLGYVSKSVTITVAANEISIANVTLENNFLELEGITIQGLRQGQASALNQQKTSDNIKNIVASDLIGRFPDQNVADALRRIPAVSIQRDQGEARYVQIRGTNPNLSNISINGEQIPAPEGDVRFVALDMIPNDILSAIEVNKAITPDMDGDAIGGSVNLKTLSAPNEEIIKMTIAPGYNNLAQDLSPFGGIFSATYGNRLMDGKLGFMVSSSYNRSNRASNNIEMGYDEGEIEELQLRDYELTRERWGNIASLDYKFNSQSRIYTNIAYTYFSDQEYRRLFAAEPDKFVREFKDRLEKQNIFNISVGGEHPINSSWSVDYMTSYSYANQDTPSDRNVVFEQGIDAEDVVFNNANTDFPTFSSSTANAYDYSSFELDEFEESNELTTDKNLTARLNLTNDYSIGSISGELKFGGLIRSKDKNTAPNVMLYGYDGDFLYSDVQGSFEDDNFLDGQYSNGIGLFPDADKLENYWNTNRSNFEFEDEDSEVDSKAETFTATENTAAAYVMTKVRYGKLNSLIGARYELTDVDYTANEVEFNADGDLVGINETTGTNEFGFFLPMVHLTYEVTPLVNIRAAWTNSFAKPNYFDLAPYRIVNREDEELEFGNPNLDATTSSNFDLMGEYYFNSVGIISAGVFLKQLDNFIYITTYDNVGGTYDGYTTLQPVNGGEATLAGFELNLQQQLTFLPGFASGFGVYANYTYSWSEAELTSEDGDPRTVALPGQSENTGNFALSYEKSGFSGRISLSYAGSFIDEIRDAEGNDRIYDEHLQIDFSASQRINDRMTGFVELINLTNEPLRYYNGISTRPEQQEFYSFWGNAGIKIEF